MFVTSIHKTYRKHLAQRVDSARGSVASLVAGLLKWLGMSVECTEYVRGMVVFRTVTSIWCKETTLSVAERSFGERFALWGLLYYNRTLTLSE